MKMITDSLEKVYTAMGGADDFDKSDITNGIEQISEVAGGGGSGGSGVHIIETLLQDGELVGLNASYNDLKALYDAGTMMAFKWQYVDEHESYDTMPIFTSFRYANDMYYAIFIYAHYNGVEYPVFSAESADANLRYDD